MQTLDMDQVKEVTGKGTAGFDKASRPNTSQQISFKDAVRLEAGLRHFYGMSSFLDTFKAETDKIVADLGGDKENSDPVDLSGALSEVIKEVNDCSTTFLENIAEHSPGGKRHTVSEIIHFHREACEAFVSVKNLVCSIEKELKRLAS